MSLQLELADLDNAQDRDDLLTIYSEAGRPAPQLQRLRSCHDAGRLLHTVAEHPQLECYAVRFNSRLIAACMVCRKDPRSVEIDMPGVRASSADRGVEARLLRRVLDRLAPELDSIHLHVDQRTLEHPEQLHLSGWDCDVQGQSEMVFRRQHARD